MSSSKAIDPDHDISDHHYYDNCTDYSYYCSYYGCIVVTIIVIYVHNEQYDIMTNVQNDHQNRRILSSKDENLP